MFERYTEPARRALFFSRHEASLLGSLAIEPEHILLGVARTGEPLTDGILSRTRLSTEEIRRQIRARTGRDVAEAPVPNHSVEIPFTATAKRVLEGAAEESDRLLHRHIGPEHLLLGLLRQEHGISPEILETNGLTLEAWDGPLYFSRVVPALGVIGV
ncbi:MAG TPA: Clp protease N-terminal domain-containing protein [Vicinamibacterales bacterium]